MTFNSNDWPFDKEIQFCQFVRYLYDEEPIYIQFKINNVYIKFFVYYNEQTCDVFEDFLLEMNSNLEDFASINKGWGKFYVRAITPPDFVEEYNKCWEFVSMNENVTDLANNLVL